MLGHTLLAPDGRGLRLIGAGVAAMRHAEQLFQLGEALPAAILGAIGSPSMRLTVGISDGLPKLAVRRLMQPVMHIAQQKRFCHEGRFDDLRGELVLHRLDVVLADRAAPAQPRPQPEGSQPCAGLLEFERHGIKPNVVGEFEDSALLKTFGAAGMDVFPVAEWAHDELTTHDQVVRVGCARVSKSISLASPLRKKCGIPWRSVFCEYFLEETLICYKLSSYQRIKIKGKVLIQP